MKKYQQIKPNLPNPMQLPYVQYDPVKAGEAYRLKTEVNGAWYTLIHGRKRMVQKYVNVDGHKILFTRQQTGEHLFDPNTNPGYRLSKDPFNPNNPNNELTKSDQSELYLNDPFLASVIEGSIPIDTHDRRSFLWSFVGVHPPKQIQVKSNKSNGSKQSKMFLLI